MKINLLKSCLLSLLLIISASSVFASEFCDGFEQGYSTGYKKSSGSSMNPFPPMCPMEPMKHLNDPESDFEFGYTIGFQRGLSAG